MSAKIGQLKLVSSDGKSYLTDCANAESMFRIIQSIPSKKAEPFKRWLAKVGYDRVGENDRITDRKLCLALMFKENHYNLRYIDGL